MTLKVCMQYQVLKYFQVCSDDDPGLTLTYFTTRSDLVPYAFEWVKVKTMDFSETIVVYDMTGRGSSDQKRVCLVCKRPRVRSPRPALSFVETRS